MVEFIAKENHSTKRSLKSRFDWVGENGHTPTVSLITRNGWLPSRRYFQGSARVAVVHRAQVRVRGETHPLAVGLRTDLISKLR